MGTVILLLSSVGAAVVATFLIRKRWRFTDVPTSDAAHVFPGLGEVHGTVEAIDQPARAASDGRECVWWHYKVEREVKRDKSTDWVTEEEGVTAIPFHIRDTSGTVRVILSDATTVSRASTADLQHLSLDFLRPYARTHHKLMDAGLTTDEKGLIGRIFGSNDRNEPISSFGGKWRATERRLLVGDQVFLTGHARLGDTGTSVEIAPTDADGKRAVFELTVGDEAAAKKSHANIWLIGVLIAAALGCGAAFGYKAGNAGGLVAMLSALLVAAFAVFVIGVYNRVHRARNRGEFAWSLIDVACEQRAQVIPQLNTIVGAAMANEQHVLAAIAAVRGLGRTPQPTMVAAVRDAADASVALVARMEAHPHLTSQTNVAQLIQQLSLLNDRVAFARRFYNDSSNRLADRLGQFPDSLIGRAARVRSLPLLDANAR